MEFKRFIGTIEEFKNSKFFNELKNTIFAICETENAEAELYVFNTSFYNKNQILALINEKIETIGGASVSYDEENETIIVDNSGSGSTNPLRPLFLAEGALYNDTNAIIKRTAPWKTEEKWQQEEDGIYTYWEEDAIVDHLPGHYYLNGIGDITEDEMIKIYNAGYCNEKEVAPLGYENAGRTNFGRIGLFNVTLYEAHFSINAAKLEIMNISCRNNKDGTLYGFGASAFNQSKKLRKIIYLRFQISTERLSAFTACTNFEEFWNESNKHIFKVNQSFADCPNIYKRFILAGIKNASPTTAITITLHPDAYARIANQPDILKALKEKNGYTDESGNKVPGTLPTGASINLGLLQL